MSAKVMIFKQNNRPKPMFTPRFSTLLIKMQTPLCLEKMLCLEKSAAQTHFMAIILTFAACSKAKRNSA
ncbi:MAG: hypothetical protein LUC49_06010 [Prevotella sp.]|nr:hypothetical protein [Prevotella sp.]